MSDKLPDPNCTLTGFGTPFHTVLQKVLAMHQMLDSCSDEMREHYEIEAGKAEEELNELYRAAVHCNGLTYKGVPIVSREVMK